MGDELYLEAIDLHLPEEIIYERVENEDVFNFLEKQAHAKLNED